MTEPPDNGAAPHGFDWPEWVPAKIRDEIEHFHSWHDGADGWRSSAIRNGAPDLGARVTLPLAGRKGMQMVTGRHVHAWNNIGRLVSDDGSTHVVFYARSAS